MFQLNNKTTKNFNVISFCILVLMFICLIVLSCFAESKIIGIKSINEISVAPNIHEYRIITNLFSGTKALVDENNNMILHTTSSKDEMGFLYDNITSEKRFVYIMVHSDVVIDVPDRYEGYFNDKDYEIYDKYKYYDLAGNEINIDDDKMFKIDYLIGNYMIYNTWNEKEPEMKAYKIDTNKIVSLGNYNYLSVVDDKIILSKDVYDEFYPYGHWMRNNKSEEGTYTLGNNKMLICDKDFNKIKEIDKYAYLGISKFKTKIYYKIYSLDSRNDYPENPLINFLDEDFNVVLDMPVYENAVAYEDVNERMPDIVCEVYNNVNGENNRYYHIKESQIKDLNIKGYRIRNSNNDKDIYTLKDFVKIYDFDFEKKEIVNIIDGKILSKEQLNIYESFEEYGRFNFKNGSVRLIQCEIDKYILCDKYYNLIYPEVISNPDESFEYYVSDNIEDSMCQIKVGKLTKTIVFDKDYNYKILEDELKDKYKDFDIGCGKEGYYYVKEKNKNFYDIHSLKSDKIITINSDKKYEEVMPIFLGQNVYIELEYSGYGRYDLFDLNGKLLYKDVLACYKTSLKNKNNIDIYHLRLMNNEIYCDENFNILIQLGNDNQSFRAIEKDGKILYIAKFNYSNYCLINSDFEVITKNFRSDEEYVRNIKEYDECIEVTYDDYKKYYDYDGKELKGFKEENIKNINKDEWQNIKILDKEVKLKKENIEYNYAGGEEIYSSLYSSKGKKICSTYKIIPFDDDTFITIDKEKVVYYDKNLNKKEILSGYYSIENCREISYMDIKSNFHSLFFDNVCILPLNEKPEYYIFREFKNNGRYFLLDKDFNIILSDFKGLSECDEKYVNYLYGFKYGLYDIDKKEFVSAYTIFDNFDDDENDYK